MNEREEPDEPKAIKRSLMLTGDVENVGSLNAARGRVRGKSA